MARTTVKLNNRLVKPIKDELAKFFKDQGVQTRIRYRTCQEEFGQESPHNMIPNQIVSNRITIFLFFKSGEISASNLSYITAIPDGHSNKLPKLKNPRLPSSRPKIDLQELPKRYIFRNLADLKENYQRIFNTEIQREQGHY